MSSESTTTRSVDWGHELIEQLDWHWTNHLRPGWNGLTDEEYFWEPVPDCWSLRPQADGTVTADYAYPEPKPAPFTTIAWRLAHIGSGVLGERASNHFGDGSFDTANVAWPGTAADGLAFVDEQYANWMGGLRSLDADDLARPCGPAEGPFADYPFAALILHINREVIHHGAEVACLRDLFRHRAS